MGAIAYRLFDKHEDYVACERMQKAIWGFADLAVVPNHILITFQQHGGIVLGAFDGDELVGYVFGFVGTYEGRVKHTSIMSAVRPAYRNRGVAYRLKCEQRRLALAQGYDLMTWTFDPLQAQNAHFNLNKLGVILRRYQEDLYGSFRDEINRGLPTDRFLVEWWLTTPHVAQRLSKQRPNASAFPEPANRPRRGGGGDWEPEDRLDPHFEGLEQVHIAIPADIDALKARHLELTLAWRYHVRRWFEAAFGNGFLAHAFDLDRDRGLGVYTLSRSAHEAFLQREESD